MIGAALLAMVVVPAMVALVLKALGLVHGASLHTWLHDVGQNVDWGGAAGSAGAGAAAGGSPGNPSKNPNPCESESNAVDDAKQQVDSAQNHVDALKEILGAATANLPQQAYDTWLAGQQAQSEWYQNPTLWSFMGPVEQLLERATGDLTSQPGPNTSQSTNTLVSNLSQFFDGNTVSAAITAASLGDWNSRNTEQDPGGSATVPFATQEFINSLLRLEAETNYAAGLLHQLSQAQEQLDKAEKQLQDAQQALADCQASNSGNGASGGDGAGA